MAKVNLAAYTSICDLIRGGFLTRNRVQIVRQGERLAWALAADGHGDVANALFTLTQYGVIPSPQKGKWGWCALHSALPFASDDPVQAWIWLAQVLVNTNPETVQGKFVRQLVTNYTIPQPAAPQDEQADEELPTPPANGKAKAKAK